MAAPFLALQCPSWPPWERVVTRQLRKQSWASLFVGDTFQNAIPPTTNRNYRIHLTEENLLPFTLKQKPDTRRFPAPPSPRQWDFCLHGRRTGLPHRSRALQCLFTNNLVRSEFLFALQQFPPLDHPVPIYKAFSTLFPYQRWGKSNGSAPIKHIFQRASLVLFIQPSRRGSL